MIQTALSRLIADKTVLVIAHRMRTVAGADKIVVLSEGTVAEDGAGNIVGAERPLRPHGEAADREPELEIGVKILFPSVLLSAASAINLRFEKYHHGLKQSWWYFFNFYTHCKNL